LDDLGCLQRRAMGDDNVDLIIIVVPSDPAIAPTKISLEETLGITLKDLSSLVVDLRLDSLFSPCELDEGGRGRIAQHVGRGVNHRRPVKKHSERDVLRVLLCLRSAGAVVGSSDRNTTAPSLL